MAQPKRRPDMTLLYSFIEARGFLAKNDGHPSSVSAQSGRFTVVEYMNRLASSLNLSPATYPTVVESPRQRPTTKRQRADTYTWHQYTATARSRRLLSSAQRWLRVHYTISVSIEAAFWLYIGGKLRNNLSASNWANIHQTSNPQQLLASQKQREGGIFESN